MQVKAHYRSGRRRPWEARWWVNRKPRSKFFETEKERDRFIREFQKEMGTHGEEVFRIDAKLQREWIEVAEILPGVSPIALAEHWLSTRSEGQATRTFTEAMQAYLLEMKRAGRDREYQSHTLRGLTRFASHYGDREVGAITTAEVSEFIHGLSNPKFLSQRHGDHGAHAPDVFMIKFHSHPIGCIDFRIFSHRWESDCRHSEGGHQHLTHLRCWPPAFRHFSKITFRPA